MLPSVEDILPSPVERQNAGVKLPVVSHTRVCPLYTIHTMGKLVPFSSEADLKFNVWNNL